MSIGHCPIQCCSPRCGSYNTYSGCRPTCSSRCNIRPSCPSVSGNDYSFAGNTLYCGNRQPRPQWGDQGYGQGYDQGYGVAGSQGYGQGFGQGNGAAGSQGYDGYAAQAGGGCNYGGCSASYGGYQAQAAQPAQPAPYGVPGMVMEDVHAVTLPAPVKFADEEAEGSGNEE